MPWVEAGQGSQRRVAEHTRTSPSSSSTTLLISANSARARQVPDSVAVQARRSAGRYRERVCGGLDYCGALDRVARSYVVLLEDRRLLEAVAPPHGTG